MLRSPAGWALAVRRDDGAIVTYARRNHTRRQRLARVPFVRGLWTIAIALPLGLRSMRTARGLRRSGVGPAPTPQQRAVQLATLAYAVVLAVAVFQVVPARVAHNLGDGRWVRAGESFGAIAALGIYIGLVRMLPSVRRLFGYHGAEHQVVAAYEAGLPVSVAAARGMSRLHPRCGSTFVLVVLFLEGVIHVVAPFAIIRTLEVPLALVLAYELQKRATACATRRWSRAVLTPGMWLQRLTTRTPDDGQLEVAAAAMHAVLRLDRSAVQPVDTARVAAPVA
jgi:uncharacterized protein YqhQ